MYFCGLRGLNSPEYAINSMYINSKENNMGFKILPNTTGQGSVFNQISGPLSSLYNPSSPPNLIYPSDLASNPAMCHAIQFSIYDYTTTFEENRSQFTGDLVKGISDGIGKITNTTLAQATEIGRSLTKESSEAAIKALNEVSTELKANPKEYIGGVLEKGSAKVKELGPGVASAFQAPTYRPKQKGENLATISLYMPDSLQINHNANYSDISMTDTLGLTGIAANAYSDSKNRKDEANFLTQSGYGRAFTADIISKIAQGKLGMDGENVKDVLKNASGIYTNPQIQLVYKGIELRTFSLQFTFTPKSSQEAKATKDIIDTFTFYSVPGKSAAIAGNSGQYLTPPQLMSIKFLFLGKNGIAGSISNVFSSALNNLGLNTLTSNPTQTIKNGQEAKVMTVSECVLTSVGVDYAPNGWASFNDGYPVQTTLSLSFQETEIMTKDKVSNSGVASNYNSARFNPEKGIASEVSRLGGSRGDFITGSNGFGNYGE